MIDIVMKSLMQLAFIILVIGSLYLICLMICRMIEEKNNGSYEVIEETEEIYNEWAVKKAIIVLGNEKIEVEVCDYEIEDNIVEIESIERSVFITDIKNVLLMSEDESIQMESLT